MGVKKLLWWRRPKVRTTALKPQTIAVLRSLGLEDWQAEVAWNFMQSRPVPKDKTQAQALINAAYKKGLIARVDQTR